MPLSLFGSVYLATFLACAWITAALHLPLHQWDALLAVIVATAVSIAVSERGRWRLGLAAPPWTAARELLLGIGFAIVLIASCDLLIIATTDLRHVPGGGFPWAELLVVYLPAAFHEELLFRGYPYQKVRSVSRPAAIVFTSLVFALLHAGNAGISPMAIINLVLAGVLLALAYEVFGRLWLPIGIHAAWNILSGPILGYNVSGYVSRTTVMETRGHGAEWLTGGHFGIEASVWMVVVEGMAIAVLNIMARRQRYAAGKELSP
ncbi:MAG: CPBP family intramembrane glutamic endopeptidase [Acidobacteriota bacterium]